MKYICGSQIYDNDGKLFKPLNAGHKYTRFLSLYWHIECQLLNIMLKIKRDINQRDVKIVNLHFVKSG